MKIYKPKGLTTGQIIVVTTLGVIGGVYIWKPLFEEHFPRKRKQDKAHTDTDSTEIAVSTTEEQLISK